MVQPFVAGHEERRSSTSTARTRTQCRRVVPLPAAGDRDVFYLDEELCPAEATAEEREIAEAALACAPATLLYGRVDLMGNAVLELEIAEPSLYLGFCDGAAARFAAAIARRTPGPAPRGNVVVWRRLDTRNRPLRDLRISVTDRCNFRCVYCMPKEVFGRDYAFLDRARAADASRRSSASRGVFVAHGVEKIRITGGEPLVRRDLERLDRDAGRDRRARPDADDERLAAPAEGARRSRDAGPAARHGQPRLARRRGLRAR